MIHLLHVESELCMSKNSNSKSRLDDARSECLQIWMPFDQVQISNHDLISNDDVQLIHTTKSHEYHPNIRNYHWSYLRFGVDD